MPLLSLDPADRLRLYNTLLGDDDPSLQTGSWEWNTVSGECLWSDSVYAILGIQRGTVTESPAVLAAMVHPDDQDRVTAAWEAAARTGDAPPLEYRVVRPDNQIRVLRARGRTLTSTHSGQAVLVGTVTDCTAQSAPKASTYALLHHRMQLARSSSGDMAVGAFLGKDATLSLLQYELLQTLIRRQLSDEHKSDAVRGFCPSAVLLTDLPWETPRPDGSNLKQLVRRTRGLLKDTGLAIESKRGLGYRLQTAESAHPTPS